MKLLVLSFLMLAPSLASARVPDWWRKVGWSDNNSADDRRHDLEMARMATRGPVKLRLHAVAADVEVIAGVDKQITVKLIEGEGARVSFREEGSDRIELLFNGMPLLRCGRLCVEVPAKSAVDLASDSGDVVVQRVGGDVRVRVTAGDVRVENAAEVDARSVSGDVIVQAAQGEVRAETVSGDIRVGTTQPAARVSAATTSGDIQWKGNCGAGCRLEARTLSGDIALFMGDKSAFALRFLSHGGEVNDELNLSPRPGREAHSLRARYGSGDGIIEAQTIEGDLHLARAK
jgi:hypothetical protein